MNFEIATLIISFSILIARLLPISVPSEHPKRWEILQNENLSVRCTYAYHKYVHENIKYVHGIVDCLYFTENILFEIRGAI